ncbi:serine/threonine protein kinase [Pseudobutyrivibrio xylanivorans]|uniref:Serine/threonine protein kinase n=1 Tax=Pseudobutyrivibrio xylanivorans TaxID=185007 RepID=A0A5P6VM45_PSEXY|nr:serine/threonine-protein kinase [Pseudobutyrivibrio xylanivorans]QFJ53733.1 serine/threonine protein kinase [Pseudobutyrivibrio xylanivorans]
MLEIGSVIDGKYKILNKIGQGGMSVVYLAMNERANKQWAIKEIRKDSMANSEITMQSLRNEIEMLKNLSHPNLPSIVDIIDYDDALLIVMDYVEGNTLSKAVNEYGPQSQEFVIEWAKQLCNVLGYLHSQNPPIIYRDLKPGNIMLKPDGTIVLIDFGTARQYKEENVEDTTCLGTRGYAAPEQFGGHGQTDARTDIYCLGSTMYHLVTGKNPSEPPYEMYPIRYWNGALSKGLEQIILKCTQLDPAKRYQNCAQVLYDLEHYYELDQSYRNKEKSKLIAFSAAMVLSIGCFVGAFASHSYAKSFQSQSYESMLEEASRVETTEDMKTTYINTITVDPSKPDAYVDLIDKIYLSDDNFTADEALEIREILIRTQGKATYEQLLSQNAGGYSLFAYRLGLAYFYNYEGEGNKQQAAYWLNKAASGELDESRTARAKRLGAIAEYYVNLGSMDKTGDSQVDYNEYWNDLKAVCNGDIAKEDNANTALVIYKEMASQICVNFQNFAKSGVTYSDMELQLLNIEQHVKSDIKGTDAESSDRVKELEQELTTNIEKARQAIKLAE